MVWSIRHRQGLRRAYGLAAATRRPGPAPGQGCSHTLEEVRYTKRQDAGEKWDPIVVEEPVSGKVFMTIQCFQDEQEVPGTGLIDARVYLAQDPNPWLN